MKTRMPAVAGAFYPSSAKELNKELSLFFGKETITEKPAVAALIVPHAGYIFSGEVAAAAYSCLDREKQYRNIFIIGPSHQKYFPGVSIYPEGSYLSPLGEVKINQETARELITRNKFIYYDLEADIGEHCLEVQLPFLQYYLTNEFQIVPLIVGSDEPTLCKQLANGLEPWFNEDNLFLISSDFSHYPSYDNAVTFDLETADAIIANDAEVLKRICDRRKRTFPPNTQTALCGIAAVQTLLYLTVGKPDISFKKILYKNSGDSTHGNKSRVVGYWAISVNRNIR